jgi:enoyl-CoA hydratase
LTRQIVVSVEDGIAIITLDRPEAMNALSRALRDQLNAALRTCDADPEVRAVVLTGAGDRAFSAGLDRADLPQELADVRDDVATTANTDPATAVARCRLPVIAAVNGLCMTGGLELMLACDFAVASDTARFADTHARLGLVSMWGLSQRLQRAVGSARAKQMSLTGEFVSAPQALSWGLVNEVATPGRLRERALEMARAIAASNREAIMATKRLIDDGEALALPEGLALEQREARAFFQATLET